MKKLALLFLFSACGKQVGPNQCLRQELFKECLIKIISPTREVIEGCEHSAYFQSLRDYDTIPIECRAGALSWP